MSKREDFIKSAISHFPDNGVFVEIGTHEGFNADFILTHNQSCHLYTIDPYIAYDDYKDSINKITGDELFNKVQSALKEKHGDRIHMIRKFSEDAINDVPNEIDFLYIDGNHQYSYVLKDLQLYFPKLKKGGILMGDDVCDFDDSRRDANGDIHMEWLPGCFGAYGVKKAFDDYFKSTHLTPILRLNQYIVVNN